MLHEQDRVTCYRNSAGVLVRVQGNITRVANQDVNKLLKSVDDDEERNSDGVIRGVSTQRVGVKRKLLDLRDECRAKQRRIPANVAVADELAHELLQPADVSVSSIPALEVPTTTGGNATVLAAE